VNFSSAPIGITIGEGIIEGWSKGLKGKKVGADKGSFIFTGKSVTLTATGVLHHDASVPTGQTAAASDLFYGDLGAAACTKSTAFGGLPCVDATVGSSAPHASVRIAGYLK